MSSLHESTKLAKNLHWNLKHPTTTTSTHTATATTNTRRKENLTIIETTNQTITNNFKLSHQTFQSQPSFESSLNSTTNHIKRQPLIQNFTSNFNSRSNPKVFITNPTTIISATQATKMRSNLKQQTRSISRSQIDAEFSARLPSFQLQDYRYPTQSIHLCPSPTHSINSLDELIKRVVQDAIILDGNTRALAFDMEWKISHRKGQENRTAVIQISGLTVTLIIQLSKFPSTSKGLLHSSITNFLKDQSIIKLGVGIRNDGLKLLRDFSHNEEIPYLNSYLELSHLVKTIDSPRFVTQTQENGSTVNHKSGRLLSLQYIVGTYLDVYLAKGDVRTSDWNKTLTQQQLEYAAADVVATVRVFQRLRGLAAEVSDPAIASDPTLSYFHASLQPLEPNSTQTQFIPTPPILEPVVKKGEVKVLQTILSSWVGDSQTASSQNLHNTVATTSKVESQSQPSKSLPTFTAQASSSTHLFENSLHPSIQSFLEKPICPPKQLLIHPQSELFTHTSSKTPSPQSDQPSIPAHPVRPTQAMTDNTSLPMDHQTTSTSRHESENLLTRRVKQAWELWYHEKVSIKDCSIRMGIKPISVASYIGKAVMIIEIKETEEKIRLKELIDEYELCKRFKVHLNAFHL